MTLAMRLTAAAVRLRPRVDETTPRRAAPLPASLRRRHLVQDERMHGRRVTTLRPRDDAAPATIVYLHGGAYVHPLVAPHWWIVDRLVRASGATVVVPQYALAPEGTVDDAFALLDALVARIDGRLLLAGDSAGAGLALAWTQRRRDAGQSMPDALQLFSPWLDATMTNPRIDALGPDPMLDRERLLAAVRSWARDRSLDDPLISPGLGDLAGLPPTVLHQGGRDLLHPDALRFGRRARAAGSPVEVRSYPDAFHVFMAAWWTAEAQAVFTSVARSAEG